MPPLETRTDSPGETPEVPQDPCQHWRGKLRFRHRLHSRGSTSVPPTSRGALFPRHSSRGFILSLHGRERINALPVASQEGALSTGKARGTPGSFHHSQSPPNISVHSREACFPGTASTFKPGIDSHHGGTWDSPAGKPRGKASWDSLEGKPQIP